MKSSPHYLITLSILLAHDFNQCVLSHIHHQHHHDDHHDKHSYKNNRNLVSFNENEESRDMLGTSGRCHQSEPDLENKNRSNEVFKKWLEDHPCEDSRGESNPQCRGNLRSTASITPIKIQVYIHVIRNDDGSGEITESQIKTSMTVLNESFMPYFEFVFESDKDLDYTYNTEWYNSNYYSYKKMAVALNKGTCDDLNIYFFNAGNALGWAHFPWLCIEKNKDGVYSWNNIGWTYTPLIYDQFEKERYNGVFVRESTVPGGTLTNFNKGYTLVHEVGHWLGLYHTFQGGCMGYGDFVSDTPAEAYATLGCPIGKDTCDGGGKDPIENFMDYSVDTCMERFTDGQFSRMLAMHDRYRNKYADKPTASPAKECHHNHKHECVSERLCRWKRGSCKKRTQRQNTVCVNYKTRSMCRKNRLTKCCRWRDGQCIWKRSCDSK